MCRFGGRCYWKVAEQFVIDISFIMFSFNVRYNWKVEHSFIMQDIITKIRNEKLFLSLGQSYKEMWFLSN